MASERTATLNQVSRGAVYSDLVYPYDPALVSWVKTTFSSRTFNWDTRTWTVIITRSQLAELETKGFKIHPDLIQALTPAKSSKFDSSKLSFWDQLFPYQQVGIKRLQELNGRALLADDMGLGKTVQTIGWLTANQHIRPALIICPASLKEVWRKELRDWSHSDCLVHTGAEPKKDPLSIDTFRAARIHVVNYDIISTRITLFKSLGVRAVILDEAHGIKNGKTKRTKAVQKICDGVQHIISISGTPLVNRPIELFNAINLIAPSQFPSYYQFGLKYCDPEPNRWSGGMDFKGASNQAELHKLLNDTIMIRRRKVDVLSVLPPKIRSSVPLLLNNWTEYREVQDQALQRLADGTMKRLDQLSQIEALKQAAIKGKMDSLIVWVRDFLEADGKLVLFTTHHDTVDKLKEAFPDVSVIVDGRTSQEQRTNRVQAFQNDSSIRLFIGNVKAAGVGITLTAASSVAFAELPWTPGELTQAEDRCHRIGQHDTVNIYYLLAKSTIDEVIAKVLARKAKVLEQILDGKDIHSEETILDEVLQGLIEK